MKDFEGKTAFVTGAGGAIGSAVAAELMERGARVFAADLSEKALGKLTGMETVLLDVTDPAAVNKAIADAAEKAGGLDICIHVAGGSARIAGPEAKYCAFTEQEDYVIDRVLKVNLYGAMYVSRAAAREMIARGIKGRILNFSSIVGINGLMYCTEYAAAKGGVIAFTRSFAKELGQYGITANCVAPGVVARGEGKSEEYTLNTNFLHQRCTQEDIAHLTCFLASDEARFITGQVYICDGGRSLCMKGSE